MKKVYTEQDVRRRATNLGWFVGLASIPIAGVFAYVTDREVIGTLLITALFIAPVSGLTAYTISAVARQIFATVIRGSDPRPSTQTSKDQLEDAEASSARTSSFQGSNGMLGILAFLAVVMISSGLGKAFGRWAAWRTERSEARELVLSTVDRMSKALPAMVDSETRLDSVEAEQDGDSIVYRYTLVNYRATDISAQTLLNLEQAVTQKHCKQRDISRMLERGISLSYQYLSKDGLQLRSFRISSKVCGLTTSLHAPSG